jgi:hypothetical protein
MEANVMIREAVRIKCIAGNITIMENMRRCSIHCHRNWRYWNRVTENHGFYNIPAENDLAHLNINANFADYFKEGRVCLSSMEIISLSSEDL